MNKQDSKLLEEQLNGTHRYNQEIWMRTILRPWYYNRTNISEAEAVKALFRDTQTLKG